MNMMVRAAAISAATAVGAADGAVLPVDDAALVEMEKALFEHREVINELDPEILRFEQLGRSELKCMHEEKPELTSEECWERAKTLPAFVEMERLIELQAPHWDAADAIVERMMGMPATTPEGRAAKLWVLLGHVLPAEWRESDEAAEYEVRYTRNFLIELVGGEPGKLLRDQFA